MGKFLKRLVRILSLVVIDLAAYYLALLGAFFARIKIVPLFFKSVAPFSFTLEYVAFLYWIPLIYIFFIQFQKLYFTHFPFWEETRNLLRALTVSFIFVFATIYIRGIYGNVLRSFMTFLWLVSCVTFPLFRYLGKKLLFKLGIWRENVLVMGSGENARLTIQGLVKEEHLGYKVIGLLDDHPENIGTKIEYRGKSYKIYGEIDEFLKYLKELKVETVFIANPYTTEKLTDLINHIYKYVRRVIIVPDIKGVSIFNSELHFLFMEKLFMIKVHNELNSRTNVFIKRSFDLLISFFGFILISPFFLLLMFLVKVSSRGPIFFTHERIGKDGKVFKAVKFRTMYPDAKERLKKILESDPEAKKEWEENYKLKNDPRVTPVGKFLRKTSLDELPQIFNIIKGEMSLVGPRPVIQEEIDKYYSDYRDYYYSVTPGLSGLWQISGRSNTDYEFRVQTDVWYVQNWSMWLDIIILLQTPLSVLKGEGAY